MEINHAVLDAFHRLGLVIGLQGGGVDGFETHKDDVAAGPGHEVQEFMVLGRLHPDLGAPFDFQTLGQDALAQFLGALAVRGEVVVAEEDVMPLEAVLANFFDHPVNRVIRCLRPNIRITEQKLQLKGQPREVAMEMTPCRFRGFQP